MNELGFLDRSGVMHCCGYMEHTSKAQKLCEELYPDFHSVKSVYDYIDKLLAEGFVMVNNVGVTYKFFAKSLKMPHLLTKKQRNWLEDNTLAFPRNKDQKESVERLLEKNNDFFEDINAGRDPFALINPVDENFGIGGLCGTN